MVDGADSTTGERVASVRSRVRKGAPAGPVAIAARNPVARVLLDVPLAHLDRPFDYLVPEPMSDGAVPGCRVRVRFAGRMVDGFVLERQTASEHTGALTPIDRVVSPEPVLAPEIAQLARVIADRYAGTTADVLRLAVPPRHARAERDVTGAPDRVPAGVEHRATVSGPADRSGSGDVALAADSAGSAGAALAGDAAGLAEGDSPADAAGSADVAGSRGAALPADAPVTVQWKLYPAGHSFLAALGRGESPRAVWSALPGAEHWPAAIAAAAAATVESGRGVVVVVPDKYDVARIDAALVDALGPGRHLALTAELGPAERYRRFLAIRRGTVRVVIGTRAAAFAPAERLGLVVCWDDGDDLHEEPRAPYPHAREVLTLRAHEAGAAALVGGFAVTAEGVRLVRSGWARVIRADRRVVRTHAPRVVPADDAASAAVADVDAARAARLPTGAWSVAKAALERGPVLVQVPRGGYAPALACFNCRLPARCPRCSGPLSVAAGQTIASCAWCGVLANDWACPQCGERRLRARVLGAVRTAEELGRAFPAVPVVSSTGERRRAKVSARPALVVATPGAEPVASGGYVAALLLDGWALLGRADLRAGEEALRRWLGAAALVRSDGVVVVMADRSARPVQALIRWAPEWYAERELGDRTTLGFPPAVRMAAVDGTPNGVRELLAEADLPPGAQVLGPVPTADDRVRALVRVAQSAGVDLAEALKQAQGVRSARKATDLVRVRIDPHPLI